MIAAQLTFTAGTAATSIVSGNAITVYGIILDNGGADGQWIINESDDSTEIMRVDVQDLTTTVIDIPFKADNGLVITAPNSSCNSTVFHSAAGL